MGSSADAPSEYRIVAIRALLFVPCQVWEYCCAFGRRSKQDMSFKSRVALLACAAFFGVMLIAFTLVVQLRNEMVAGRRAALVMAVQAQRSVVDGYRSRATKGEMAVETAKSAA